MLLTSWGKHLAKYHHQTHNTWWYVHWVVSTHPVESNTRRMRTPDSHLQGHEAVWKQPSTTWFRYSKYEVGDWGKWALKINNEKWCLSKRTKPYSSRTHRCSPQPVACIRGYEPSGSSYSVHHPIAFITRIHFRRTPRPEWWWYYTTCLPH